MNIDELLKECKKIKKQSGESLASHFYKNEIFTHDSCPKCKVTGKKLSYDNWSEYFTICGSAIKNTLKKYNNNIEEVKKIIENDYIFVEELYGYYSDFRSLSTAIGKRKMDSSLNIKLYEKYFELKSKCILESCSNKVLFSELKHGGCCLNHYNKHISIKKGKRTLDEFCYSCKECNESFANSAHLTIHIEKNHMSSEEYYNKHISPEKGKCKWCKKPTKFNSISSGYDSFCYNTSCNVNYHNNHTNRHKCGEKISNSLKQNKNMPNQKEYWMKKGMDEENAIKMVSEKQTTNSIKSIMKRTKCSKEEAIKIRKSITEKWLESLPKLNYSKVSQELFWEIYNKIKNDYNEIYFATLYNGVMDESGKNHEYKVPTSKSYKKLDFYVRDINKAIEFVGTYWHSINNKKYTEEKDIIRENQIIESIGCKILNIKEQDYYKDKQKIIQDCLNFLKDE